MINVLVLEEEVNTGSTSYFKLMKDNGDKSKLLATIYANRIEDHYILRNHPALTQDPSFGVAHEVKEANDRLYNELKRSAELLKKNNPNFKDYVIKDNTSYKT